MGLCNRRYLLLIMPFLPSLLEYSPQALELRLQSITEHRSKFQVVQKSPNDRIYLHLDFVLPQFADSRSVEAGNSPEVVLVMIDQYFGDQKVVCNSHFMGLDKDVDEVLKFFETYSWNPNWEYIFYVGREFLADFESKFKIFTQDKVNLLGDLHITQSQITVNPKIRVGVWLNFDQYNAETKFELKDYLLMTVFAGKSGQKLTEQVRLNTLKIVSKNPDVNFTIDGGWTVVDELAEISLEQQNTLAVVSYSSFWKEFEKLTVF
jgi:hypothetical protein